MSGEWVVYKIVETLITIFEPPQRLTQQLNPSTVVFQLKALQLLVDSQVPLTERIAELGVIVLYREAITKTSSQVH